MDKKILFLSHNAGRSGAPLMLLNLLKWFRSRSDFDFEVLLHQDGPLRPDFEAIAPVHLAARPERLGTRITRRLGFSTFPRRKEAQYLISQLRSAGIGLIYANTITNGAILEELAPLECPVITHVHELEHWIQQSGLENLEKVKKYTTRYIAASRAVQKNLTVNHGVMESVIDVVHSFIPIPKNLPRSEVAARIRGELGIPPDAFVILGAGHETWRKGKDLFVQLAARICKKQNSRPVHFLWIGGWQRTEHERNILHNVRHLGVSDCVHFTGEVQNPLDYFAAGDVFAMVSREDPFPLVCLEAAALGKPVLCFADAGGMPEFVEEDAGFISPYLDLNTMADRIMTLHEDPVLRSRLGGRASEKVRKQYSIAPGAEKILETIKKG